jgi:hypothetical protein
VAAARAEREAADVARFLGLSRAVRRGASPSS